MNIKPITILAVWAALLSACQTDEMNQPLLETGQPVQLDVCVGGTSTATRAGLTTSAFTGDDLALYLSSQAMPYSDNVKFTATKDAQGTITVWTPETPVAWRSMAEVYSLFVYTPYRQDVESMESIPFHIDTDQATNGIASSDLMAYASTLTPASDLVNGAVPIVLNHLLSKLNVELTLGSQNAGHSVKSVLVTNTCTRGTLGAPSTILSTSGSEAAIAMSEESVNSYTAIVMPGQTLLAGTQLLEITLSNDAVYRFVPSTPKDFVSGNQYTLKLRLGRDEVTLASPIGVEEWGATSALPDGESKEVYTSSLATFEYLGGASACNIWHITDATATTSDFGELRKALNSMAGSGFQITLNFPNLLALPDDALNASSTDDFSALYCVKASAMTSLGTGSLSGCTSLCELSLPKVLTIGSNAFMGCTSLQSIFLPQVTEIAEQAFDGCSRLLVASFDKVNTVGSKAFQNCTKLEFVNLGRNAITDVAMGTNTFDGVPTEGLIVLKKSMANVSNMKIWNSYTFRAVFTQAYPGAATGSFDALRDGLALVEADMETGTISSADFTETRNRLNEMNGVSDGSPRTELYYYNLKVLPNNALSDAGSRLKSVSAPLLTRIETSTLRANYYSGLEGLESLHFPLVTYVGDINFEQNPYLTTVNLGSEANEPFTDFGSSNFWSQEAQNITLTLNPHETVNANVWKRYTFKEIIQPTK